MQNNEKVDVLCIGAGPAGLTAGYLLSKKGMKVSVIEQDPIYVGGISKTASYNNFLFDIGGHRFFSKSKEVNDLWLEILGENFLERPRKSRIYYKKKFFNYPISAFDSLMKLGVIESTICVISYLKARLLPYKNPQNFEEWVVNQFGRRLFSIFFKTYTEKVWGMDCKEISADWAAQRIKGLSLWEAIKNAFKGGNNSQIKTLINSFYYPKRGPGMMWEAAARKIERQGSRVHMGCKVIKLEYDKIWTVHYQNIKGEVLKVEADHVISSAPIRHLVKATTPTLPQEALLAAEKLNYRDYLLVALIVKEKNIFDDNWIYIHDDSVKVGRIQNFKSWSEALVPDQDYNCYGMEYFCFEDDGLWARSQEDLIKLARSEIVQLGLAKDEDIIDGHVVKQPKAYPVYDSEYKENVLIIRNAIAKNYNNLHLVGRNGMHKYNNQDHAMMTAMLTVENIIAGEEIYDVWCVNQDAEYHEGDEEHADEGGRLMPVNIS